MKAAKIDSNQPEIVEELRKIPGVTVETGHDDILVGYRGKTYWYEIKSPNVLTAGKAVPPSALKDEQIKLLANFTGHYRIVWSADQIKQEIFTEKGEV